MAAMLARPLALASLCYQGCAFLPGPAPGAVQPAARPAGTADASTWARLPSVPDLPMCAEHPKSTQSAPPPAQLDLDKSVTRQTLMSSGAAALWAAVALSMQHPPPAAAAVPPPLVKRQLQTLVLGEVEKSPNDKRDYRAVVLPNGLRVLLISDPDTKTSAAAMDVHVGHFSDPEELAGLAHFCEHMLFLGTKKYPDETSYSSYLSGHGGSSNAYTDTEDTCYFFDINADYLEGALDRFAQFFIAPQFTAAATIRELNAIESENKKNLQSDGFRVFQLEKSRANPLHPYHKFGTGNQETLLLQPQKAGVDTRQALLDFWTRYYSSNQMTLCILGKEPLAKLQRWAEAMFKAVPNRGDSPPPASQWAGLVAPFPPQLAPQAYNVVPVQDIRRISVAWPFVWGADQALRQEVIESKPDQYLGALLGHEGKGSLLSFLKAKNWANAVGCQANTDTDDFLTFQVDVELTPEGLSHRNEVVGVLFSYLRLVREKGIPGYIFDELRTLSGLGWQFQEKAQPSSLVERLAGSSQVYGLTRALAGPGKLDRQNTTLVQQLLGTLRPESPLVTVIAKEFAGKADRREKWYGTPYQVESLAPQVAQWSSAALLPELDLPKPNLFIPQDLSIKTKATRKPKRGDAAVPPRIVQKDERWLVNFKADDVFGQPKAYAYFEVISPEVYSSPRAVALLKLFQLSVDDALNEYTYDAQVAGLNYRLDFTTKGARFAFGGFNDKMPDYIRAVMLTIATHAPTDRNKFDRLKDILRRELASFDKQQPYYHAVYNAGLAMEQPRFRIEDIRATVDSISMDEFAPFLKKVLSRASGVALLQGNLLEKDVARFVDSVQGSFGFEPLPADQRPVRRVAKLPLTPGGGPGLLLQRPEPNPDNENSATQILFQVDSRDVAPRVLIELMASMLEDGFYDSLRTKQQLGYLVFSGVRRTEGISHLFFMVQSSTKPPPYVTERILEFVAGVGKTLTEMAPSRFEDYVQGLVERKLEPDQRLSQEATRNWDEIISGEYRFNRPREEAEALDIISQKDLVEFYQRYISPAGNRRRAFTSQVFASKDVAAMGQVPENSVVMQDPVKWRSQAELFPPREQTPQ